MRQPMEWKKGSPELGKLLDAALQAFTCDKRIMFGSPAYTVNRNMFAGVHADNIFIRLSESDRQQLIDSYDAAAPFEPVKGHVMKEYVVVPQAIYEDEKAFNQWLGRAYDYVSVLPPRVSKGR